MLNVEAVSRRFARDGGAPVVALDRVDLTLREHEILALVGTSGCGKSTLLRILSGLDRPTSGRVALDGRVLSGPTPEIGMVFQEPRLMPWLPVRENIRLAVLDQPRAIQDQRITAALDRVGLNDAAEAWPKALSGGMAQRAALARALVRQPSILLMDEPFSALDSFTKTALQDHVLDLWGRGGFTVVLVTHDLEEAAVLADRVVVMRGDPGRVHQVVEIDDPRPRDRTGAEVQRIKRELAVSLEG
ncbi:MAG: ABC transporter ATP-binding protein [Alphaproteobacteria bacterium]|nr:ABC transporter ATP-binding protein [Alphaproteobacteria bacterium]